MSYITVDDGVNLYYDDTGDCEALIFDSIKDFIKNYP